MTLRSILFILEPYLKFSKKMKKLYEDKNYKAHLQRRDSLQTMLGFANETIFNVKERLSHIRRKCNIIKTILFDGHGAPFERGGGKTNRFYAFMKQKIDNHDIQLIIQGQTISSNFGTKSSGIYNLEQLLSGGIKGACFEETTCEDEKTQRILIQSLAQKSLEAYLNFRNNSLFVSYLQKMGTVKYYVMTNIGSRSIKRNNKELSLIASLFHIVGSWSQLKQNVPGFYAHYNTLLIKGSWRHCKIFTAITLFLELLLEIP